MALVYCTECGTEMSNLAYACPKCAHPVIQPAPLQHMSMVPATPFYFSTPVVILCLLFCPLIGLLLMWAGRVWSTGLRAGVTAVYLLAFVGSMFMFFWQIQLASEHSGQQMQMMIDAVRDIQPPQDFYPQEYYDEMERGAYQDYEYEETPAQLTPSTQHKTQIELGLWRWSNQASPLGVRIEGTAKNGTGSDLEGLKVSVTAEDGNGMLLGVGSARLDPAILPAGGTSNFVVIISDAQCTTDELNISCRFEY